MKKRIEIEKILLGDTGNTIEAYTIENANIKYLENLENSKLIKYKEDIKKLKSKNKTLESVIYDNQYTVIDKLQLDRKNLESTIDILNSEKKALQDKENNFNMLIAQYQAEIMNLTSNKKQLESNLDGLKSEKKILEEREDELIIINKNYQADIMKLESHIKALESNLQKQITENIELKNRENELNQIENTQCRNELIQLIKTNIYI